MKLSHDMEVIWSIQELQEALSAPVREKKSIGFVPTMGALHPGHLSLVNRCLAENDLCVVSIYVNPSQFNDPEDLMKYPRSLDEDLELLNATGCHYVFVPTDEEMYPEPDMRRFNFGELEQVMEGAFRPGHFNGVAQIVSKLFDIVRPGKAYFGEKDFQQLVIIRTMTRSMRYPIEIISCPIVRNPDGLALSSRNARLDRDKRVEAARISETLFKSLELTGRMSVKDLREWVIETIEELPCLKVEYFEMVDGDTLHAVTSWDDSDFIIGCIAVYCGSVRLIDNIRYE